MSRIPRFHKTGKGSFFGDFVYDRVLKKDHFLVALQELFDWEGLCGDLIKLYKGKGLRGRPPYKPELTFKMLFLSYLYNVSERQMEQLATYHLAVKWFLGLAVDEPAPDHSTLTKFKDRLVPGGNWDELESIFDGIIRQALHQGLEMGDIQLLDSVHTRSDVNYEKERERQDQGKPPRDPDAQVVHKGRRSVVGPDGRRSVRKIWLRGYKTHSSINAKTGVATSLIPAHGNTADNKAFVALRGHDRSLGLPTTTYGGDRAYDDTDIHERLAQEGLHSGICLNDYRTHKKDPNKQRWIEMVATPEYQAATALRYRVEQPFGIAKKSHGFERCRYIGLPRYGIQSFLTFMVLNCKRMVKLLTGITFRPQAKGRRAEVFRPVYANLPWV